MDEMTISQESYIHRLLEERRVSFKSAQRIIELLTDEPKLSDPGLDTLKAIQNPQ